MISSQTEDSNGGILSSTSFITDHFHFTLVLQRLPFKKRRGRDVHSGRFHFRESTKSFGGPPRRREREREKGDGYKKERGWKTLERGRAAGGRTRKGQRDGQISSLPWVRFNLCCSRRPLEASLAAIFFWIDVQKLQSLTPR